MKKILFIILGLLPLVAVADSINVKWLYPDRTTYTTTTCTAGGDITLPSAPSITGYTFVGWKPLYSRIEYLESSGTQYIDTGFKPNQDTRVVIEYEVANGAYGTLFGCRTAPANNCYLVLYGGLKEFRSDYGSNENDWLKPMGKTYYDTKLTIDKNKNITYIYDTDGVLINRFVSPVATFQTIYNMLIFSMFSNGAINQISQMKIYSFKLYDNGTLVRDMIPVLDQDGVPCMYDTVSHAFFYNAGTGDFIAGPVISE